jgi:hypothetical protein
MYYLLCTSNELLRSSAPNHEGRDDRGLSSSEGSASRTNTPCCVDRPGCFIKPVVFLDFVKKWHICQGLPPIKSHKMCGSYLFATLDLPAGMVHNMQPVAIFYEKLELNQFYLLHSPPWNHLLGGVCQVNVGTFHKQPRFHRAPASGRYAIFTSRMLKLCIAKRIRG